MGVLNSVVKFDLHIHSFASKYKESSGIVDKSTKENIDVLLSELNRHKIALFSITDHNRFDPEIYLEIGRKLSQPNNPYSYVKAVLSGVEFDVIIDQGMEKCHIIAIFDTNNEAEKLNRIKISIDKRLLLNAQDSYMKESFEEILKDIGLNTILIACQRKDIHNQNGNNNSLSDSAQNVKEIIKVGYINALEYQKPKVEGILLNNMREICLPISLFSGSDCHEWEYYPNHDKDHQTRDFHHSKAKILPTFKGLLMAVTSPETRFNCSENTSTNIIQRINIKDQDIPLVSGINAIIGENGSGKTTILKVINDRTSEMHVKRLANNNSIVVENSIDPHKIKYIEQGHIIQKFNDNTLFTASEESNFKDIDSSDFVEAYRKYAEGLRTSIEYQIRKQNSFDSLSQHTIEFEPDMVEKNYYVIVNQKSDFSIDENPHAKPLGEVLSLINKMKNLLDDAYFETYKLNLERSIDELSSVKEEIQKKLIEKSSEIKIKNIMLGSIKQYSMSIRDRLTSKDREVLEYKKKKNSIIDATLQAISLSLEITSWPSPPIPFVGVSQNPKQGFYFNREAAYNGKSMEDIFSSKMFNKAFNKIESLQSLKSYESFSEAIKGCTSISDISKKWAENYTKFLTDAMKTSDYIMDGADHNVGNTLGEMSLSYYKFFTQEELDWRVLIVDQPEDNISNKNISKKLVSYFNAIREEKQLIFVTHNPLLVVNLDVDNVVYIENHNGELIAKHGCLEYEDAETNILDIIANNMDGGKETIEKRLKVYGKGN